MLLSLTQLNCATIFVAIALLCLLAYVSIRCAWWGKTIDYSKPRILMYHSISKATRKHKFRGLRVSPDNFEQQIRWLSEQGWTFITMSELYSTSGPKRVAITFDDGFEDNYKNALPILKKYSAKATIYLVSDRHNNDWSSKKKKKHNSGELAKEPKLKDQQVYEMIESGIFELGGHTKTHCNLHNISHEEKLKEINTDRKNMMQQYNSELSSFAYPFGIYSQEDIQLVKEAGYTTAVTVEDGIADLDKPFELARIKVSGKEAMFSFKLRLRTGKRKA